MVEEGNIETVFYEGSITTSDDFIETMQRPSTVAVFVLRGRRVIGFAYLNGFQGNMAFGHFCFMRECHDTVDDIGRQIMSYWTGPLGVDYVMGVVPGFNDRAMDFVQRIGFKRVGEVPAMIKSVYRPERADANIFYYRGEEHG